MFSISKNLDKNLKLAALSGFLVLMSSKGWLEDRLGMNPSLIIYSLICFLFFFFRKEIYLYLDSKIRSNFFSLDFLIIFFLIFHSIINLSISIHALSFSVLFIFFSSIIFSDKKQNIDILLESLLIAAVISLGGVLIGLFEGLIGTTTKFITLEPQNYPNPMIGVFNSIFETNWKYQISGFHISINYTAYVLIAGLAGLVALSELKKISMLKYFIVTMFILGLILSQAKVGYLFLTFLVIRFFLDHKYKFLILVITGYVILTHLTINNSDVLISNSHYFRSILFSLGDYDFYLSFFSWLKISAFEYLNSTLWFFGNYDDFVEIIDADPHSFWVSVLLIGGPITTLLLLIKFIKSERQYRENSKNESAILFAAYYTFIVESLTWDALDAPIFWIIFLMIPAIILRVNKKDMAT